ncbi:MAG TPA: hypothetical protein H9694_07305 [Firmicutes bacterium]|nr:hypothetical protein [Bacillota bacterium]
MNSPYPPHYIPRPLSPPGDSEGADGFSAFPAALPAREGRRRERLAVYFLSLPEGAPDSLEPRGQSLYRRMARRLIRLEQEAYLRSPGQRRILRFGDAAALIQAFAHTAHSRCAARGIPFDARIPDGCLPLTADPRLLLLAVGCLLRDAAASGAASLRLLFKPYGLQVAVTGEPGFCTEPSQKLAAAAADAHRGAVLFSRETAAFTLSCCAGQADGFFAPAQEDWLGGPLSPANLMLF